MMVRIQDGQSSQSAEVDAAGRLLVSADDLASIIKDAAALGEAFIASSSYAATAAQDVFFIKNTDPAKELVIEKIILSALAACLFTGSEATGTDAGTVVSAEPLKSDVAVIRTVSIRGNAEVTGLTGGTIFFAAFGGATPVELDFGLVLAKDANFTLEASVTTTIAVTVIGRWQ